MELLGYLFAVCIGITLGLIGGGGSILTIPVLVYFFNVEPVIAGGYSLFVVGVSSIIGVVPKFRQGLVDLKTALIFGLPSLVTVFITRLYLLPAIPLTLFTVADQPVSRSAVMMIIFALLMILASRAMIRKTKEQSENDQQTQPHYLMLSLQGAMVGFVTGFLGAGGGFLIIPALVMLSKLPMKVAVGTSLLIIAVNSMIGFAGNWSVAGDAMNWRLLMSVTILSVIGILIGSRFVSKINGHQLKKGFGWFILIMGLIIISNEVLLLVN